MPNRSRQQGLRCAEIRSRSQKEIGRATGTASVAMILSFKVTLAGSYPAATTRTYRGFRGTEDGSSRVEVFGVRFRALNH